MRRSGWAQLPSLISFKNLSSARSRRKFLTAMRLIRRLAVQPFCAMNAFSGIMFLRRFFFRGGLLWEVWLFCNLSRTAVLGKRAWRLSTASLSRQTERRLSQWQKCYMAMAQERERAGSATRAHAAKAVAVEAQCALFLWEWSR